MATVDIGTYSGLLAAIADWLNRADLADQVPNFVRLAEAAFNRELRVRDMQIRTEALSSKEFVTLPNDYLQQYSLALNPVGRPAQPPLAYVGKYAADTLKAGQLRGPVGYYTIADNAFELIPAPTANVDLIMVYYAKIPSLSATTQTNWLLTRSPDLYLASSILQAAPYLNDQERLQTWAQLRAEIMANMNLESERSMRSTTQLTARARAF